jgi:hypothetical protein
MYSGKVTIYRVSSSSIFTMSRDTGVMEVDMVDMCRSVSLCRDL